MSRKDIKGRVLRRGEYYKPGNNGSGRYEYRYKDVITGNTRSIYDADLAKLRQKEKEIERNNDDGISNIGAKRTLNQCYEKYMQLKKGTISPYTYENYRNMYELNVKNTYLATRAIGSIRRSDIKVLYHDMIVEKKYAVGTVMVLQNLLYPIFELAVDDNEIRSNPCKGAVKDLSHIQNSEPRISLSKEELNAFLNFTRSHPYYCIYYPVFVILVETGMRISEFTGMTKKEIVVQNGKRCFYVDHQIYYKNAGDGQGCTWHAGPPKTGNGNRYIPISKAAEQALQELDFYMQANQLYDRQIETCGYKEFLFSTRKGRPYKSSSIGRAMAKIIEEYNQKEADKIKSKHYKPVFLPHFSPHTFRHTFATFKAMSNMPPKMLQYLMGHGDISITMNIYSALEMNTFIDTVDKLDTSEFVVYEPQGTSKNMS